MGGPPKVYWGASVTVRFPVIVTDLHPGTRAEKGRTASRGSGFRVQGLGSLEAIGPF